MAKYVLFGSTNETGLHFIRHATASNFKVLCLYPYESRRLYVDRNRPLLSSLGGIPIPYNFRTVRSFVEGASGPVGLKTILEGADGVVWAADPDLRETTLSRDEDRYRDYFEDIQNTVSRMKRSKVDRFLCLTNHSFYGRDTLEREKWGWNTQVERPHSTYSSVTDFLISGAMKDTG